MDFTKLTPDKQPITILENLIAWHGVEKVLTAYDAWLCNEDKDYYETHGVRLETAEVLAKEVADVIGVDREYYINDEPAIETELVKFLENWGYESQKKKEDKPSEVSFKAVLAKNQIARMIKKRDVNWAHLESCLQDIENHIGEANQPSIKDIINSSHNI